MKKIIYIVLAIASAIIFSSYAYSTKEKVKISKDSTSTVNINVTAKNIGPYELKAGNLLEECLKSTIDINKMKADFIKKAVEKPAITKEYLPSTKEVILEKYGLGSSNFIVKRIRNDTLIKWISIVIMFFAAGLYLKALYVDNKIDWKIAIIRGFFMFIFLAICQLYLYYTLSFLFNNEYLTMKELINLLI